MDEREFLEALSKTSRAVFERDQRIDALESMNRTLIEMNNALLARIRSMFAAYDPILEPRRDRNN